MERMPSSWPDCAAGDLEQRADLLLDLFGYQTALREKFAAVRYAMTDGLHFVERPDYAVHGSVRA